MCSHRDNEQDTVKPSEASAARAHAHREGGAGVLHNGASI